MTETIAARRSLEDWVLLMVLVVCWGSSFAMVKVAVETLSPAWLVLGRMVVGAAVLAAVLAARGERLPRGLGPWSWYVWLAIIGYIVPFMLISWGTQYIASGLAGICMSLVPLSILITAHFMLPDEPITPLKAAGFVIGLAGAVVLLGPENLLKLEGHGLAFWGQVAILGATVSYGLHGPVARLAPRESVLSLATAVAIASAVLAVPIAILEDPAGYAGLTLEASLAVTGLGLLPTAVASLVLYRLLARAGAAFVSLSNYLIPVFAVVVGAVALEEAVTPAMITGMALILAGIAVSQRRGRSLAATPDPRRSA